MRQSTQLATTFAIAALLIGATTSNAAADPDPSLEKMSPEAQALIEAGDELAGANRYGAARNEYRAALRLVREDGNFPITALRRIANTYYFEGSYSSAATTLEKLADEAASFGDLVTQVWAIADAGWMYGKLGAAKTAAKQQEKQAWTSGQLQPSGGHRDNIDTQRLVVRLERLLRSPYLPDDVRDEVTTTRLSELTIIAER